MTKTAVPIPPASPGKGDGAAGLEAEANGPRRPGHADSPAPAGLNIPSEYRAGFARARLIDPGLAELYVRHTTVGDPGADAVIAELAGRAGGRAQEWIQGGIERGPAGIPDAPAVVRDFFAGIQQVPDWFDTAQTLPGCRAFHRHSEMFTGAFVAAVLIEGFCTLISKSFSITGRMVDAGVRRLQQNNRHLVEIFLPGGLERDGDGWKLSVRIRLMHARVRHMLARSEEWDTAAWGTPLSAAHIAFATAAFSGLLLKRARMLGVELSRAERESFMLVWRCSGHLMGVAPELLFRTEAEALRLHEIGSRCEPPPDLESIMLANGLINSAPLVAGITEPAERRKLAAKIYLISRALIGDELAGQLNFPPANTFGALATIRWKNRLHRLLLRLFPAWEQRHRATQFQKMLDVSAHSREGISYRLPGHLHAEKDRTL